MSFHIKERWDIYLNGTDGLKQVTRNMLTMWGGLMPVCGTFGETLVAFLAATARVSLVIALPMLFWLAPLVAIFTAHRAVTDDEIRARLRRDMHRNGRGN